MAHLEGCSSEPKIQGGDCSNFDVIESRFDSSEPIHRLFSQARSRNYSTLLIEEIPEAGDVLDENQEIQDLVIGYELRELLRVSFWRAAITELSQVKDLSDKDCIGYAILKKDFCDYHPGLKSEYEAWHIFESVLIPYEHPHNYLPFATKFEFRAHEKIFTISGSLYCQQNRLNKSCAQVAIRSIAASYPGRGRIPYSKINNLALRGSKKKKPWSGLSHRAIKKVLDGLDIPYRLTHFSRRNFTNKAPYQRFLYGGIESGYGALMGFFFQRLDESPKKWKSIWLRFKPKYGHLIPFFGHTFNEDTWAPSANNSYFKIDEYLKYTPSESWVSSFISHDDNFGSNLCVPYGFVQGSVRKSVFTILPKGYVNPPLSAEVYAASALVTIVDKSPIENDTSIWFKRLKKFVGQGRMILRTTAISFDRYVDHLRAIQSENTGQKVDVDSMLDYLGSPEEDSVWMTEVSVPHLFQINQKKLGELIYREEKLINRSSFVLGRLPGKFYFQNQEDGKIVFDSFPSEYDGYSDLFYRKSQN